jgi:hypothetical protein
MGLSVTMLIEKSNYKISSHSENLNLIIIHHYRYNLKGNCILRYINRISRLASSDYVKTPPSHHINYIYFIPKF